MEGPYREPKPIGEIIEPDRRRAKAIGLVVFGMIAGIGLWKLGGAAIECAGSPPNREPALAPPPMPLPPAPIPTAVLNPELDFDPGGETLAPSDVQRVVARHRSLVKRACWDRLGFKLDRADVRVNIVVGASGQVASATATGTNAVVASCVEELVRTWQFPVRSGRSGAIVIPFEFVRE